MIDHKRFIKARHHDYTDIIKVLKQVMDEEPGNSDLKKDCEQRIKNTEDKRNKLEEEFPWLLT